MKAKGVGEEVRGRLSGHGFSTEASLLICGSKAAGVPRGMALLVAGRSPRRGGRERSDRWKGESVACSLQRDDVGNERADESIPEPNLTEMMLYVKFMAQLLSLRITHVRDHQDRRKAVQSPGGGCPQCSEV